MAYNKVVYDGRTLVDLTADTVDASVLLAGYTAHGKDGSAIVGTFDPLNMFYPVGSYYETSDADFDPNTAWGGTWVLETAGQVHVSAGTGYTIGATGGSTSKSYTPQGSVQNHALTVSEIPSNTHDTGAVYTWYGQGGSATTLMIWSDSGTAKTRATGGSAGHNHGFSGTQASIDVMQPYITVNRWHRTA